MTADLIPSNVNPRSIGFHWFSVSLATRAKMSMMNSMSRIRGQEKGPGYTQTEVILGEAMQKFGRELGEESNFGELQHIKSWSQKV